MIGSGQIIIIIIMVEKTIIIIIIIIIIMIIHYQKDWGLSSNHLPTCPAGIPMNQPVSGNDILGQMTQAP
jgi:hypothetical protein